MSRLSAGQLFMLALASGLYFIMAIFTIHSATNMCRSLVLGTIFLLAAAVDMDTYTLPDTLTIGGAVLALFLPGLDVVSSVKGGLAGFGIMGCIAGISRGGMGGGDVKLALAMGTFLGWPLVLPAIGLSFCLGGSIGLILLLTKTRKKTDSIPFGPFLTLGTLITSLWGQELVKWYVTVIWRYP